MENINFLAYWLGYKVASFPMKYLRLPLGASFKARNIWEGVIEKVKKRLLVERGYTYLKRRLTLFKNTISNLPTYFLS